MDWWVWLIIGFFVLGAIGNAEEEGKKKKAQQELLKRQKEAEDYIMSSGDIEAIKMLVLIQRTIARFLQAV